MFIYKEDSFSDVIRRKAAQKAALLFFYSRPPQAGTFSYKSPAAGRLLSAPQAPYQSAARAALLLPCLSHFLSRGTVAFDPHAAFFTVPFPLFSKRHGSVHHSNQNHVKPRYRWAPSLIPRLAAKRRNSPCGVLFIKIIALKRSFYQKLALVVHFYQKKLRRRIHCFIKSMALTR